MSSEEVKPAVLIIGGLGFIGRWLALYIHQNDLASEVRIVDKVLPQLAWLAPEFDEASFQDKFMQADATREQHLSKIFTPEKASQYNYVFNCGGETRYSHDDSVYTIRSVGLTRALANECARRSIDAYIEFSTAMVYKPASKTTISSGGCTETAPTKPSLKIAKHKLIAEQELERIREEHLASGEGELKYAILRLPIVYGLYDSGWLGRGLCVARVYKSMGESLKWLWSKDLRTNTVHVQDVADAAWKAASWASSTASTDAELVPAKGGRVFNIADEGDTSQALVVGIMGKIFDIETGFQNALISAFAKLNLDSVIDDINEHTMQPWAELLAAKGITRTGPIGPFMESELIMDCEMCISAARARTVLDWKPAPGREKLTFDGVMEIVRSYERMGWWP